MVYYEKTLDVFRKSIYDHISKQYSDDMSDKQVVRMIKYNHAKWRKNNMA